jgi:metallo-beta-lactamase class B
MMIRHNVVCGIFLSIALVFAAQAAAQDDPAWTKPFPPFRIAGNLYYVGSEDLASYLVVTAQGNILINSGLEANVPQIQKSVERLGFNFRDTKILLISHAHRDHCAGASLVKKLTGAQYFVMDADVPVVESGGKADFQYGARPDMQYPPAHVDHELHDGETVELGDTVLTAHLTAGHTKGTTTWTMDAKDGNKTYHVVIVGGPNVNPDSKLVDNTAYSLIADDFAQGFDVLKGLPCDIFLGAHGSYFDLEAKYARMKKGDHDAFNDPIGYKDYIADREKAFQAELAKQSAPK